MTYDYDYNNNKSRLSSVTGGCACCSSNSGYKYYYNSSDILTKINDGNDEHMYSIGYSGGQVTSITNAQTLVTTYDRVSQGTMHDIYVVDSEGNSFEYKYDNGPDSESEGELTAVVAYLASGNHTYDYEHDASYRITEYQAVGGGPTMNYAYDAYGRTTLITATADSRTITQWQGLHDVPPGDLTKEIDTLNQTTEYKYNSSGLVTRADFAGVATRHFRYDDNGLVTLAVDATGASHSYDYNGSGVLTEVVVDTQGLSLVTAYEVDSAGRVTLKTSPEGRSITREYQCAGPLTKAVSAEGIVTEYEYDDQCRETKRSIMEGEDPLHSWETEYDAVDNVTQIVSPGSLTTTYAYDTTGNRTLTTYPDSRVSKLTLDELGRVLTREAGIGSNTTAVEILVYDSVGNVVSRLDGEDNLTQYMYDGFGIQTKTTDSVTNDSTYAYDDAFQQTEARQYAGTAEGTPLTHSAYVYDALGRVVTTVRLASPSGSQWGGTIVADDGYTIMEYDEEGRPVTLKVRVDGSNTNDTILAHDGASRTTKITDPDSYDATFAYDNDGWQTKLTDANGHTTGYAYDDDRRQIKVTDANGDYAVTVYDKRRLPTDARQHASGGTVKASTEYAYDDAGRRFSSRRKYDLAGGNDTRDYVVQYAYDSGGDMTKLTGASGNDTTYAYDQFGRPTLITLADDSYTAKEYDLTGATTQEIRYEIVPSGTRTFTYDFTLDGLGRVVTATNPALLSTLYVYDGAGRQVTVTDEGGQITVGAYDALSHQTDVTEDDGGSAPRETHFAHDRAGRLIEIIADNVKEGGTEYQTTSYAYNGRGLQTVVTYEETGDVSMTFDAGGNMTRRIDEAGVTVNYAYDDVDRLTSREGPGSNDIEQYAYDALGRLETAKKGSSGNPDLVSQSVFSYDALSQVTKESQAMKEGTAQAVDYTYDKGGNRVTLQHDDGELTARYAYDSRDRCTRIDDDDTLLAEYTWLGGAVNDRTTYCDYPDAGEHDPPAFRSHYERDGLFRVMTLEHTYLTTNQSDSGYEHLGTFEYGYDPSSNALSSVQTAPMGKLDCTRGFDYDGLNRLVTARLTDWQGWLSPQMPLTSWYDYDDLGNRESHQYRLGSAIDYAHDKANRMTTVDTSTQRYDLAGNLTNGYSVDRSIPYLYEYDHLNKLTAVYSKPHGTQISNIREAAFDHDALGRRIEFINDKLETTTQYYYDGVNEIVETDEEANNQRAYIHGVSYVDERLMMMRHDQSDPEDDRPYYYVLDRMYNVWLLLDRAGAIVERYCYDPYGRPLVRESAGRGDMNNDTDINGTDSRRVTLALLGTEGFWDPRADMNDDGSVTSGDISLFNTAASTWTESGPTVSQAFSDVGNPFMFQGRPHFAIDTEATATEAELMLNDHRMRMNDPVTGRWLTRDPIGYLAGSMNMFEYVLSQPTFWLDPLGLMAIPTCDTDKKEEEKEEDKPKDPKTVKLKKVLYAICEDECKSKTGKKHDQCITACKLEADRIVKRIQDQLDKCNANGRTTVCHMWSARLRWLLKRMNLKFFKFDAIYLARIGSGPHSRHVMLGITGKSSTETKVVIGSKQDDGTYNVWTVMVDMTKWNQNNTGGEPYFIEGDKGVIIGQGAHEGVEFGPYGPPLGEQPGEDTQEGPWPGRFGPRP